MARTFVYARVSTFEQSTANQVVEIGAAGFKVDPHRIVEEAISGGVQAAKRPEFSKLLDRLEPGDVLVVTKLDRLGRNVIDVRQTVDGLAARGVKVHCLALGGADLTSSAGRMTMSVVAAVAEFERDLLRERTAAGLERAKAAGKVAGRPARLTGEARKAISERLAAGAPIAALAREYGVDRQVIRRAAK